MNDKNPFEGIATDLLAPNTLRSYAYDWGLWLDYTAIHGIKSLPVDVEEFTDYLESELSSMSLTTLNRRLSTAKSAHKFNNLNQLVFPLRLQVLKNRIRKEKIPIKQAEAMRLTDVHNICETQILPIRDRALVSLMFDAMLRGQDALHLRWSDIIIESDEYGKRGYIRIIETKGKFNAIGEQRALSRRTILLLDEYHTEAAQGFKKPESEKIFPIKTRTIRKIFNRISERVEKTFTSHSPRVGATVEMVENGISEVDICINAGWSSVEMVRRYARKAQARNGGMTKLMNKTHESKWIDDAPNFDRHHQGQ